MDEDLIGAVQFLAELLDGTLEPWALPGGIRREVSVSVSGE
ncbi:hypothetical protein [Streptomyces sp. NPDC002537]